MTRRAVPQLAGDAYADVVTWKWSRALLRWEAVMPDGLALRAQKRQRRGGATWLASVHGDADTDSGGPVAASDFHHPSPDLAQGAALELWRGLCRCRCAGPLYHPDKPCPVHPKTRRSAR